MINVLLTFCLFSFLLRRAVHGPQKQFARLAAGLMISSVVLLLVCDGPEDWQYGFADFLFTIGLIVAITMIALHVVWFAKRQKDQ